jgi:hypothetical protein
MEQSHMNTNEISVLLASCETEARTQGWTGIWTPTAPDLEWVCSKLGRKPTRKEWVGAGFGWVGNAHVLSETEEE